MTPNRRTYLPHTGTPATHPPIVLDEIVDVEVPGLQIAALDSRHTGSGAIDLDGNRSRRVSLSFSPPDGLLRLDARLGRLAEPTREQALRLLALGTRFCWVWLDREDGTVFLRAAAPVRRLSPARFALRMLVHEIHRTLVSEQLAVTLASGNYEVTHGTE